MNNLTDRFLKSIKLKKDDYPDLKLDRTFKKNNVFIFYFEKDSFWDYYKFICFLEAVKKNINYSYNFFFSYKNKITKEEIESLFRDYYFECCHFDFDGKIDFEYETKKIKFIFDDSESDNNIVIDEFIKSLECVDLHFNSEIILEHKNKGFKNEEDNKKDEYKKYDNFFEINEKDKVDIIGEIFEIKIEKSDKKNIVGKIANVKSAIYFFINNEKNVSCSFEELEILAKKKYQSEISKLFLCVRIKGYAINKIINKKNEICIVVDNLEILPDFLNREDNAKNKRIELHLHTNMSQSDGVVPIFDYINLAKKMGHKAIGITDHGVIQSFPYAQKFAKDSGIKILYGCEFYMVNSKLDYTFNDSKIPLKNATYVCLDLETTGLSVKYDRIIEFGAVKIRNNFVDKIDKIDILINPKIELTENIQKLTHITNEMLYDKPIFSEIWPKIKEFIGDSIIIAHNAIFDISFLNSELEKIGLKPIKNPIIDTLSLSRYFFKDVKLHNLNILSRRLGLDIYDADKAHRANFDANVLANVWLKILNEKIIGINPKILHCDLSNEFKLDDEIIRHLKPYHVIVFAKNNKGLKDLFRLITLSHVNYFDSVPKIPRNEIEKFRDNFIIGSACSNGEIFDFACTKTKKDLFEIMKFYDYVEIQPLSCYENILHKCKYLKSDDNDQRIAIPMPSLKNEDEIIQVIKDIVNTADELKIPVCVTGDVHYLNKEDKIFREVYIATDGIGHKPHPLCTNPRGNISNHKYYPSGDNYYRNTDEMINEFINFFGYEKTKEIVIDNPNIIADKCEFLYPIKDKLYTPQIDNADDSLRKNVFFYAEKRYGKSLPNEIFSRIELELSRIINDKISYSVNYLLAYKIVKKAKEDGFFVGSRGSVGSSLVANLLGITEVNPLPPHYLCHKCKKIEWNNSCISGIDLPEKKCDRCNEKMFHDGQNIPFETFLGIDEKNTKIPDIDLNFPSPYQPKAHNYLREEFGSEHVFRAGTINTYKNKTSLVCVKDYFIRSKHEKIENVSKIYLDYLSCKCAGVKKTTGQHPGGIILIPKEFDIYDFTPIQFPADDIESDWKTTHFEISTIHDTVLKLDLLGHVDPLALKMMSELTNVDFTKISLNDKKVLSLFSSPKALSLKKNSLEFHTGTLGLPEFGTNFVQNVLKIAKPKTFNDLLIISGITHGTDVWTNNAEKLLKNKIVNSLSEIIGCRDDIMNFLIKKNISNDIAFKIMEDVRKGNGLKQEYVDIMKLNNVPDFYIDSCNKIKYLFPRAHATAYVIQAVRIGYFKVNHPLVFYAVYFTTRIDKYDVDSIKSLDDIKNKIKELKEKKNRKKITNKENIIFDMLKISLEMYERGFKFSNIDINKSDSKKFIIDDKNNSLIPPFIIIDGLGDVVAETILEERKKKQFDSVEDFKQRTSVNKTQFKKLLDVGAFNNIKIDSQQQLSLL